MIPSAASWETQRDFGMFHQLQVPREVGILDLALTFIRRDLTHVAEGVST